jgi:hypothetical protein
MDIQEVFTNDDYMTDVFSDCIHEGASLKREALSYSLVFPDSLSEEGLHIDMSLDGEKVSLVSNIEGFNGTVQADEFLSSLDVLTAKILSVYDGIDRGV